MRAYRKADKHLILSLLAKEMNETLDPDGVVTSDLVLGE